MGTVYRRGRTWYVNVMTMERRVRKRVGPSKKVAELVLKDIEVKIAKQKFDLDVITPRASDREVVHNVIYHELCMGKTNNESKSEYLRIIEALADDGTEAVILGCTEIGMLIKQSDTPVKLYDTAKIHAEAAVAKSLEQD